MVERLVTDPTADLSRLERVFEMRAQEQARLAEREFNTAMALVQESLDPVRTNARNDQTHSQYATLSAVDQAVRPAYSQHGFSLTFNSGETTKPDHVRVTCTVMHAGGHTKHYWLDVPADGRGAKGGQVMTATHALGSAVSYGRRYLLCMIFSLATEKDDDGNAASGHRRQDARQEPRRRPVERPAEIVDPATKGGRR